MNPKDAVGVKKAALRFVPPALAIEASGPMADGAEKYGPFNWRAIPVEVVGYVEAVFRHLYAYLDGQDVAEDSGHSHIGHAIAGLGIIADAKANGTLIDNRYAKGPAADMLRERDKSQQPAPSVLDFIKEARMANFDRLAEAAGLRENVQECPCPPDWPEHALDCPAFHLGRS